MHPDDFKAFYLRDLTGLERELELYPDEAAIWQEVPGLPNSGGTLILHVAGNTQHFFGAVLARTSYVRDREAEFARRDVPRHELRAQLAAAKAAAAEGFEQLTEAQLRLPFPARIGEDELPTGAALLQFLTHLAYHLGQVDYHRRAVTGDAASAGTLRPPAPPNTERPGEEK